MSDEAGSRSTSRNVASTVRIGGARVVASVRATFASRGAGFRSLAQTHAGSVGGDTLVALALANTLFFSVPSAEARENVALYLLLTLTPFAVIGPFLGRVFARLPAAYRASLILSSGVRVLAAVGMAIWLDSLIVLLPLAFVSLVFSRFHGIARSSVLPVVVEDPYELISANAHLARLGVLGSAIVLPLGGLTLWLFGPVGTLIVSGGVFAWSAITAVGLPTLRLEPGGAAGAAPTADVPRTVRLARFATAGVRFLNGFLLLLVAFSLRESADSSALDLGAVLVAGGVGFFLAAVITPVIDRLMGEEPMVVAGLAIEAGAAFISAQLFGVPAAAALAAAAGLAWGTAKFGFDGLLQATVPVAARGRSFTNAETFFQAAWVVGALIPVVITLSPEFGLSMAGILALVLQVVYISAVLVPAVANRRASALKSESTVLDIL
jgi:hypothetical protein